ncbi:MAG: hemin-degrading factor [Planctomycetes bacterium]|nr:hemin-degrading factor [Planctomycetota bacterium]
MVNPHDLVEKWQKLKSSGVRLRDAAQELGTSEAKLLECALGQSVLRLNPDFDAILTQMSEVGPVKAISRNDACVIECIGPYLGFKRVHGPIAILNNLEIDLRVFMNHWAHAYAVKGESGFESCQFFDKAGHAIHKIYATPGSNNEAFDRLCEGFAAGDQDLKHFEPEDVEPHQAPTPTSREELLDAWSMLEDTHDFNLMLRKQKIGRVEAIELAQGEYTERVSSSCIRDTLNWASQGAHKLMFFVGNKGAIQIYSGGIQKVVDARGWLNVLDPSFNLHLKEDLIAKSFLVRKPTKDGDVNSIEVFDERGELIVQCFGVRKPGQQESEAWRSHVSSLV